ncbi:hypothetical protein MCOR02_007137 [Pyricularia oryzae]|nr:hypothetical protein MCOR02_007137 [Pyricularia oryzae]
MRSSPLLLLASFLRVAMAHGDHGGYGKKPEVGPDASWMDKHMAEEHHADHWDAASFFTLHDFNSDGHLDESELLRTYGVFDESNKHVTKQRKDEVTKQLMDMLDTDHDGFVAHNEFLEFIHQGKTLPDLGLGRATTEMTSTSMRYITGRSTTTRTQSWRTSRTPKI